jgi:hypothetical protein
LGLDLLEPGQNIWISFNRLTAFSLISTIFGGSSVTSCLSNHWLYKLNLIHFWWVVGWGGTFNLGSSFFGGNLMAVILISLSISSSAPLGSKSMIRGLPEQY